MTKEDEIDSFDDLAGMTLDLSDKNIVPDDKGKVEIDVSDAVQQGNMARTTVVYWRKKVYNREFIKFFRCCWSYS